MKIIRVPSNLVVSWCLDLAEIAFKVALVGFGIYGVLHLFGVVK